MHPYIRTTQADFLSNTISQFYSHYIREVCIDFQFINRLFNISIIQGIWKGVIDRILEDGILYLFNRMVCIADVRKEVIRGVVLARKVDQKVKFLTK